MKTKKLLIVGDSAFAEVAYEYFDADSEYEVVAFAVESEFIQRDELFGLPVVAFETVEEQYLPEDHDVYVAVVYTQLNRLRTRLMKDSKSKGFRLASYVSSQASIWRNVNFGEHCFIFENNTIQAFTSVGDNVVMWSGNHIGHHSTIQNNCFISSHVVISGFCDIGENSFLGVNSTISNNITIGKNSWLGPNTVVMKDCATDSFFKTESSLPSKISPRRFFKVPE